MDLSGIISISGRPGLYRVIAQGKNSIIVESLTEKKRFPAYTSDRISALDDISIYTYDSDVPIREIFAKIFEKQDGKSAPSHKEDSTVLQEFILEIIPDYDEERVYPSDIKKLIQWYNMLLKSGDLKPKEEEKKKSATKKKEADETSKESNPKKATSKKTPTKKPPAKKTSDTTKKKAAPKKNSPKTGKK